MERLEGWRVKMMIDKGEEFKHHAYQQLNKVALINVLASIDHYLVRLGEFHICESEEVQCYEFCHELLYQYAIAKQKMCILQAQFMQI